MIIKNAAGRQFLVRCVMNGERYGLDDCLVHNESDPLIEFYDFTYRNQKTFGPRGQFVSRYYASTLAECNLGRGLNLEGSEPNWSIDGQSFAPVIQMARSLA